ncbi:MAG TPA: single-stranded DNA-binding protein [Chloroflexota bacterium]|nr:single-stranded DNA-binding protein [Chloroflexota bacterium]
MRDKAIIRIMGNVGADPTTRMLPDGTPVTSFSVAVNERPKRGQEGGEEITAWYRVSAWRRQAEIVAEYVRKGVAVQVEGAFHVREYTNREGARAYSLDIEMRDFDLLTPKAAEEGDLSQGAARPNSVNANQGPADNDPYGDDFPF